MSGQEDIFVEIFRRKWRWVGHTLRKDQSDITREAIFWTAEGKQKRGTPKLTWPRTTENELKPLMEENGNSKSSNWVEEMCVYLMCHLAQRGISK